MAVDNHLRAEFVQHGRRGFVTGAVGAIHDDAQTFQRHAARKTGLGKFDVAAQRVVNAHGLADLVGTSDGLFQSRR